MLTRRISRLTHLARKAMLFAPEVVAQPRVLMLAARGVHIGEFLKLNQPWLQNSSIKTIIDVGANTGQFASAARAVFPHAQIYSFEPLPECYETLIKQFSQDRKFRAFNTALGAEEATVEFHRSPFTESSSILEMTEIHRSAFPWTAGSETISVTVRPLDAVLAEVPLTPNILVKIDVQGYEDRVLRGGERILRSSQYVLVETPFVSLYEDQSRFEDIYSLMKELGFYFAGCVDPLYDPADGRILQADSWFLTEKS